MSAKNKRSQSVAAQKKDGRGRKKGSVSFVTTTLAELNRYLRPEMPIFVSRKWLEDLRVPVGHAVSGATVASASHPLDMRVHEFQGEPATEPSDKDLATA